LNERLYADLAPWWPALSPPEEYVEEAAYALDLLADAAGGSITSLLELGSGGGHLASWLGPELEVVLVDRSEAMLTVSRQHNPDREHVQADLRSVRLERRFDAVLLHDAVMYLTSEADLRAALTTIVAHLRPGGAALVIPDLVAEDYEDRALASGGEWEGRSARLLEWCHSRSGTTFEVDYAFLLKDRDGSVRCEHDRHVCGLFDRPTWWRLIDEVGLDLVVPKRAPPFEVFGEVLLARRR